MTMKGKRTAVKAKRSRKREKVDVGASILKSLGEAVRWANGEDVPGVRVRQVNVPSRLDVKAIRRQLSMSQAEFSERFGFSASTLRNWEQGTRQPETTARLLLTIIARAPEVVERVLRS